MMWKRIAPVLLILLLAFFLRVYSLSEIPPGLTHDEANHGREALGILGGELALFFPLNYGSEPLYSYTVAALMGLGGRNILTLRLVNVYFGLLTVAACYLWARLVFDRKTGLLAAALIAVSFWPVAASREALRAGMMPFFSAGAMIFYWLLLVEVKERKATLSARVVGYTLGFAFCLIATLYNYLAARVLWLLFPLFLCYLALAHRSLFRRLWRPTLAGLLLVGLSVIPMAWYLSRNPEAQTRLDMLDSTIQQTLAGDFLPIMANVSGALLAFVWPGQGDQFLAYNIPGRPVFGILTAALFLFGLAVCLWRWRKPAYAFLFLWFLVGVIPSLLTGATANTTRNVGAYVPAFVMPAVGFVALAQIVQQRTRTSIRPLIQGAAILWLFLVFLITARDYFVRWGQQVEVRAAYQHTLVEALSYLASFPTGTTEIISSVYPEVAHNPSIGLVLSGPDAARRWLDARFAMIIPGDKQARLVSSSATPVHPAFDKWLEVVEREEVRSDDLNPEFVVYRLNPPEDWLPEQEPVTFGVDTPALQMVGDRWLASPVLPGDVAEIMHVWKVIDPLGVGPLSPQTDTTDVVFFTHVLREDGTILVQQDSLDAPSWDWQEGDFVVQVHQMQIPPDASPGLYQVVVGVYDRASGARLPLWDGTGETRAFLSPLEVVQP